MIGLQKNHVGYFTSPEQVSPVHDPPFPCACPVCGEPMTSADVRTVSIRLASPPESGAPLLSLFYRLHRTCAEEISNDDLGALDNQAFDFGEQISRELAH